MTYKGFRVARAFNLALAAGALFLLSACERPSDRLVVTGSSTIAPLIQEIAERYEAETGTRVDVQSGGSGRGIQDALKGTADIGMASRALQEDELAKGLRQHLIAFDGIALIVHRDNGTGPLNDSQIRDIYTGRITDWTETGGQAAPVTVINKAEGRSTLELFLKYFELDNRAIQADIVAGENQQVIKSVSQDINAIGYVSVGTAEYEASAGTPIRLLPLNGIEASIESVRSGRYPLRRELNLVTVAAPDEAARNLLRYAQSPTVADLIRKHYFVVPSTRD